MVDLGFLFPLSILVIWIFIGKKKWSFPNVLVWNCAEYSPNSECVVFDNICSFSFLMILMQVSFLDLFSSSVLFLSFV